MSELVSVHRDSINTKLTNLIYEAWIWARDRYDMVRTRIHSNLEKLGYENTMK